MNSLRSPYSFDATHVAAGVAICGALGAIVTRLLLGQLPPRLTPIPCLIMGFVVVTLVFAMLAGVALKGVRLSIITVIGIALTIFTAAPIVAHLGLNTYRYQSLRLGIPWSSESPSPKNGSMIIAARASSA